MEPNPKDLYALSPAVQAWVVANADGGVVVELGGGHGSRRLQERVPNCTTIECDEGWYNQLREWNVHCVYAPLVDGWYDLTDEVLFLLRLADMVIVDGPTGQERTNCEQHLHLLKDGCVVLFDDTHRKANRALVVRHHAKGWELLKRMEDPYGRVTHILRKVTRDAG